MVSKRVLPTESLLFAMLAALLLVAGCADNGQPVPASLVTEGSRGQLVLSMPAELRTVRAIDESKMYAVVVINGRTSRWNREDGPAFIANDVEVSPGSTLEVLVDWYETQPDDSELQLASLQYSQVITQDVDIVFESSDYDTEFDDDEDSYTNLEERRNCSSPRNPASVPASVPLGCSPVVRIGRINPEDAPDIDGLYRSIGESDSIWNQAQFLDEDRELLKIDNLMTDEGLSPVVNDEPGYRWFAMHDDTYLYVFVLGEPVDTSTPIRDSGEEAWNDDNINLFIDGDNSKLSQYDGVDDRHILVPLLTSQEEPDSNSTVFETGANSAELPDFEFATCYCTGDGEHTWEFKIPMAEFNIVKDRPFGFEIQLDDDYDGGARDAKWGWFHPSRTTENVDYTWTTPEFMAIVVVE